MLAPTSRYTGIEIAQWRSPAGEEITYLRRRFVPDPDTISTPVEYSVVAGDRLDNVTARYLGDPELFWRLCDANRALRPEDLTAVPGRTLGIPVPTGV